MKHIDESFNFPVVRKELPTTEKLAELIDQHELFTVFAYHPGHGPQYPTGFPFRPTGHIEAYDRHTVIHGSTGAQSGPRAVIIDYTEQKAFLVNILSDEGVKTSMLEGNPEDKSERGIIPST